MSGMKECIQTENGKGEEDDPDVEVLICGCFIRKLLWRSWDVSYGMTKSYHDILKYYKQNGIFVCYQSSAHASSHINYFKVTCHKYKCWSKYMNTVSTQIAHKSQLTACIAIHGKFIKLQTSHKMWTLALNSRWTAECTTINIIYIIQNINLCDYRIKLYDAISFPICEMKTWN